MTKRQYQTLAPATPPADTAPYVDATSEGDIQVVKLAVGAVGTSALVSNSNSLPVLTGLVPPNYDYIELGYTGDNLTNVVYKTGGSAGTTIATLTLAYTGAVLDSITKT